MLVTCRRMLSIHSYLVILLLYLYITMFIGLYVCSCSCSNSLPQFSNVVGLHCVHAVQIRSRRVCEKMFLFSSTLFVLLRLFLDFPSLIVHTTPPHHNRFTALFPGPPGWAGARRELLDFMVQGEINRGRHTDHSAGRHSFRTNQCPPPPSPISSTQRNKYI